MATTTTNICKEAQSPESAHTQPAYDAPDTTNCGQKWVAAAAREASNKNEEDSGKSGRTRLTGRGSSLSPH